MKERLVTTTIMIPDHIRSAVKAEAALNEMSMSRQFVEYYLEHKDRKDREEIKQRLNPRTTIAGGIS